MVSTDIDYYLNPIVPANWFNLLPTFISRWFGYRQHAPLQLPEPLIWLWSGIGAFLGVSLLEGVFRSSKIFQGEHVPMIIGSFGATAILVYNAIESPLSQPRNVFFGHLLCAVVSVAITKLFLLASPSTFENHLVWVAGALCCAVASSIMGATKTVHPPAGATALLAAVDPSVRALGWYLLPVIMLSSVLVIMVACVVNNVQRRYPAYWWTPADLRSPQLSEIDEEKMDGLGGGERLLIVRRGNIEVPEGFMLAEEEKEVLRVLQDRLREGG